MIETSGVNPFEPPQSNHQDTYSKGCTPQQLLEAIKSSKRRLKKGESKAAIYDDYKLTPMKKQVRRVLLSYPTNERRRKSARANYLLLAFSLAFLSLMTLYHLHANFNATKIGIVCASYLITAYHVAQFHRSAYWFLVFMVTCLVPTPLLRVFVNSNQEWMIFATSAMASVFGVLSIGFALFLMIRLFPDNKPLVGPRRTPQGEPVFDS